MTYPPMYFGITNRLEFKDEYGYDLDRGQAHTHAEGMKIYLFEKSEWKEENKKLWQEFAINNPNDKAVRFMLAGDGWSLKP